MSSIYNAVNFFKKLGTKFISSALAITEIADTTTSAPQAQIDALSQQNTVSQLLFYRFAEQLKLENGDEKTLYTMDDGRKGIIIEVIPPVFLGTENERDMHEFFNSFTINNLIVHINTFASRNIDEYIDGFKHVHNLNGVNVGRRDLLKEIVEIRADFYKEWVSKPMGKNGVKLRNFVNTISILFPENILVEEIIDVYTRTENLLEKYSPRDMKPDKLITVLSEFLKPEDLNRNKIADIHQTMNSQIASGANIKLENDTGYFKLDENWNAVTLTTEKFPKKMTMFDFQSAFFDPFGKDAKIPLSCPFVCSLVIAFENVAEEAKKTLSKAQWNIGHLHLIPSKLEKQRPIIKHKREENENIVTYISDLKEYPVKAQWTLTVFDDNIRNLKRNCGQIKKKFNEIGVDGNGWILKEESYSPISFQSFLMGFPLQYSEIVRDNLKRFRVLFKSNNAQITPLIGGNKSGSKPVLLFPDRTGQAYSIDFFDSKKNYNVCVIGPSGTGKSFLVNEIMIQLVGSSAIARLVDIGDSYKDTTEAIEGKFIEFSEEKQLCFNFFTNIATTIDVIDGIEKEVIDADELSTIVPIIGAMLKLNLKSSSNESNDPTVKAIVTIIEDALQISFDRQQTNAGMQTVWEYLGELRVQYFNKNQKNIYELLDLIIVGLHDYVIRTDEKGNTFKGKNYSYFNGVNNIEFESSIFTFEMEKLTKKGDDLLLIISMIILHQMANEAFHLQGVKKIIGVDEAKRLLEKELFVSFLDDLSRRIRKYDGILLIITQYIKDFFANKNAETLFEGASYKIFLEQEEDSIDDAAESGKLSMNDGEIALMKSVKAKPPFYNEFLLKMGKNYCVLLNKVDPVSYWLFTTNPKDKIKISDACSKYGFTKRADGAWFLALLQIGKSEEEAYNEIIEKSKIGC